MYTVRVKGDFAKTITHLSKLKNVSILDTLRQTGEKGVEALASATPKDSGKTATSWSYKITPRKNGYKLEWINKNTNKGANIALLIQHGHGTGTGAYIQGVDYINPAIRSTFDSMVKELRSKIRNA